MTEFASASMGSNQIELRRLCRKHSFAGSVRLNRHVMFTLKFNDWRQARRITVKHPPRLAGGTVYRRITSTVSPGPGGMPRSMG